MDLGGLVERIKRLPGAARLPQLDAFDARDDTHIDAAAAYLLDRFHKNNDVEALSLLFELAHPRLAQIARQLLRKLALAVDPDDLVATFMTRIFTDLRRPQPRVRKFLGLAHTAMRNDALNQQRSQLRALRRMVEFQTSLAEPNDPAHEAAENEQERGIARLGMTVLLVVQECFHDMRLRDRRALLLREVDGLSYEEVAAALKVPENQVGAIIKRARQRLADRIAAALGAMDETKGGTP